MLSLFGLAVVVALPAGRAAVIAVNAANAIITFILSELQRTYACRRSRSHTVDARRNTLTIYSVVHVQHANEANINKNEINLRGAISKKKCIFQRDHKMLLADIGQWPYRSAIA